MRFSFRALVTLCSLLFAGGALAQTYVISSSAQTYVPLTGATVLNTVGSGGSFDPKDEGYAEVPLGFSFPYYGQNYTSVGVSTNGVIVFDTTAKNACNYSSGSLNCTSGGAIPRTTRSPHSFVAAWWEDLSGEDTGGQIRYKQNLNATTPSLSETVIEYVDWGYYSSSVTPRFNFQVKLRANGTIQIHYGTHSTETFTANTAAGFENSDGSQGAPLLPCSAAGGGTCGTSNWPGPNTIFTIGEPQEADLVVDQVDLANMVSGATTLTFDVSPRFRNFGKTAANNFQWRAWLSTDKVLQEGTDQLVFTSTTPVSVGPLATVTATGAAVANPKPASGAYYVLVKADHANTVTEFSDDNNVGSTTNTFTSGVDLVAVSISGPTSTGPGNTENVQVNFINQGTNAAGTVAYQIVLSADTTIAAGDFVVHTANVNMTGAATFNQTIPVNIPPTVPGGDFYWGLIVDSGNAVTEASEANNTRAAGTVTKVQQADLIVDSVDFLDAFTGQSTRVGNLGTQAKLKIVLRNAGGANASNFKMGMVLSTDSNLSLLSDFLFPEQTVAQLNAGQSTTLIYTLNLPLNGKNGMPLKTGPYYFFALADSTAQVGELNEANNNLAVPGSVTLRAPAADYAAVKLEGPATAAVSEIVPVSRTFRNVGSVNGTPVAYRYFASVNDLITPDDVPLAIVGDGNALVESGSVTLAAGAEDVRTEYVKLPPSMAAGTYYLGVLVDSGNALAELDEANNAVSTPETVQVAGAALRIVTQQLPDAALGRPYTFRLVAVGEQVPSTWALQQDQGPLPAGLTLAADGTLSGTPSAVGVSAFTVVATSGSQTAVARLVMRVQPNTSEFVITSVSLPPVVNNPDVPYQASLGAAGGSKPYTWSLVDGTLPQGITFNADGQFGGASRNTNPLGERMLTFQARDALGSVAQATLKMRVVEPGALIIKTLNIPDSLVNTDYVADLAAENADLSPLATPMTWSVVAGALPDGLSLQTIGNERGILRGKPLVPGTYPVSIQVMDAKERVDIADFIVRVFPQGLKVSAVNPPAFVYPGDPVDFAVSTGLTSSSYALYSGELPQGLTLEPGGAIRGTVDAAARLGTYNFVVEASDALGGAGLGAFSLEVRARTKEDGGCSATGGGTSGLALAGVLGLLVAASLGRRGRRSVLQVLGAAAVALVAMGAGEAAAQAYSVVGPRTQAYVALPETALKLNVTSSAGLSVNLPFAYKLAGQSYQALGVSYSGYVSFAGSLTDTTNSGIPHTTPSSNPTYFAAPWWDAFTTGGVVRYQTQGAAPRRIFVVEWSNMSYSGSTTTKFAFQVHLYEGSNQIRFAYGPTVPGAGSASVGIQGDSGVGLPPLTCTTSASGTCSSVNWPANQIIDFVLPPELSVLSVGGADPIYGGVNFSVTARVRNQGGQDASQVRTRFYLSTDSTLDAGDAAIGDTITDSLRWQETRTAFGTGSIPANTPPGTYYVFARVDPDTSIPEEDETNNASPPRQVQVGGPTPDLRAASATIAAGTTVSPGGSLSVNRTVINAGNQALAGSFKLTYFVSDNSVVSIADTAITPSLTLAALAAGASATAQDEVGVPAENLAPGRYWVGFCVDYDPSASPATAITEISEANNCVTAPDSFILSTGGVAVVTQSLPGATQHSAYGLRLQATGGNGSYSWALSSGSLPQGLTLEADGDLVGTPSVAGDFSFEVKVTSGSASANRSLSLSVTGANIPFAIVDQDLPAAEFSRVYNAQLIAVGGKPPYVWRLKADSQLPQGLALASDGEVEGRAGQTGEFPFSVEATDSAGTVVAKDLVIRVVNPSSLAIATASLPTGYLGKEYPRQPLQAVGGGGGYLWSLLRFQRIAENLTDVPGPELLAIPDEFGLKLESDASGDWAFRGTPRQAGLFSITLQVEDQQGSKDTTSLLLKVSYELALAITTTALPDAFAGKVYPAKITHNAGPDVTVTFTQPCVQQATAAPSGWSFDCAEGDPLQRVPPGLTLKEDGSFEGLAEPPPNGAEFQVYSFLVKAEDAQGRQDVRSLSIRVRRAVDGDEGGCSCSGGGVGQWAMGLLALVGLARRRRARSR